MMVNQQGVAPLSSLSPERVRRRLTRAVDEALDQAPVADPASGAGQAVVRVEVPAEVLDPLAWLRAQPHRQKLYWRSREGEEAVAGVGVADRWAGPSAEGHRLEALEARVACLEDERIRYYGGLRFDAARRPDVRWAPFGAYRFVLPRFEWVRRGGEAVLACNLVPSRDRPRRSDLARQIHALTFPAPTSAEALPLPISRHDRPGAEAWRRGVAWALGAFERTSLEKVVLARQVAFAFAEPLDPLGLLSHLQEATPGCFHFAFQPEAGVAFVGASPERLFRRRGRHVASEAVAGTRPRGTSAAADARLLEELLGSDKERREHGHVRRRVGEALAALSETVREDARPSELKLARGRHLYSGFRGLLREGVGTLNVLRALHPTPAVGGYPDEAARRAIERLEGFDRGWYAGPVGWMGPGEAEFAVAIRSGLVEADRLTLFSGAGIVRGSEPEAEWREIEHKISDFVGVLGLSPVEALGIAE